MRLEAQESSARGSTSGRREFPSPPPLHCSCLGHRSHDLIIEASLNEGGAEKQEDPSLSWSHGTDAENLASVHQCPIKSQR